MSILEDIATLLKFLDIPFETGVFSDTAPSKYIVIIPLVDVFDLHADNLPEVDIQEARLSLYCKGSYTKEKNTIVKALLGSDFTITDRKYIGYEPETKYHHYNIDVAKSYGFSNV